MAVDGETEPMCRDILVKSARMGHRPKPRPMKAVLMNGVTPRSKVAGVLMGTGKRDLVLLEKDDAQEVGNGEKAPLSGECGTGVEDGAAAVTGADGQEIGESRELEIVKGTAEKLEITGQTGTQAGNYVVDKRLFVLAEMQSLNVEYFALQVISLCPADILHISAHADNDAITSAFFYRVLEACVCVRACLCVFVRVCIIHTFLCTCIRKCSHTHTHTHTHTDAAIIRCNPMQA
jgi:hypothetical protein